MVLYYSSIIFGLVSYLTPFTTIFYENIQRSFMKIYNDLLQYNTTLRNTHYTSHIHITLTHTHGSSAKWRQLKMKTNKTRIVIAYMYETFTNNFKWQAQMYWQVECTGKGETVPTLRSGPLHSILYVCQHS